MAPDSPVISCRQCPPRGLRKFLDLDDDGCGDSVLLATQELLKKRRIGRLQKAMGDYSLLAGSAVDAADHYQTAADLARACNDFIWLGAAIEGLAHARVCSFCASVTQCTRRTPLHRVS